MRKQSQKSLYNGNVLFQTHKLAKIGTLNDKKEKGGWLSLKVTFKQEYLTKLQQSLGQKPQAS